MIEKLKNEIQRGLKEIEENLLETKQRSLIEIVRCADENFILVSYIVPRTDKSFKTSLEFFKLVTF